jgi:hypothetical protein
MTSPDLLPAFYINSVVKINNTCYQIDYYISTTCIQESIHLNSGQFSPYFASCFDCQNDLGPEEPSLE